MGFFTVSKPTSIDQQQSRLLQFAAVFMLLYSTALTLAPAARLHSWQVAYNWQHWIGFIVWMVGAYIVNLQLVRWLPERDPYLFPLSALLSGWGLLTIWRLDSYMGARQTVWLLVCLAVISVALRIPDILHLLRRYKYIWLMSGLLLTALTFLFGVYPGGVGPRLWLGCCGIYLQPSEPLKLLLIIYLAAYLADRLPISFSLLELLTPTLILIGVALALLVGQRDLGTGSLFILIYTAVVYIASQRRRTLVISLLVLTGAGLIGYLLFDVVRIRVDAWINPWLDPAGRSYQIIQSILAVASGSLLGRGPGLGSPGVVPVAHSDFIFSSMAEETGLLGAVALFTLFALLVSRGFRTAVAAGNNYRRYLAAGITTYLVIQAIFIIGGNLRGLPLTGVTLPFVSYGGSSLLTSFLALLILLIISNQDVEGAAPLRSPTPYLLVSGALLAGLLALALATGWWAVVRAPALLSRPENPRRIITERYVTRGSLLDRNNSPITRTIGSPGSYTRQYEYPLLSNTTGYNSAVYGQSELEAGLDDILRGLRGSPDSLIWLSNLLYGQSPPGLDVRLSIDLELQKKADALLDGHKGALVLINAHTGEILAISSYPNFDPNTLEESWNRLLQDPDAPLFNRATQGTYSPGTALGPFLLAYAANEGEPAGLPEIQNTADDQIGTCAIEPQAPYTLEASIAGGCTAPLITLGERMGAETLVQLFDSLGFYSSPDVPLPVTAPSEHSIRQLDLASVGQDTLSVTPLQMALAAAALSNNGSRPAPLLAAAMLTPDKGWASLPAGSSSPTIMADGASLAAKALAVEEQPFWQTTAFARSETMNLTWYLAGTLPDAQGTPLALALVLEEEDAALAQQIGQKMITSLP